MEAFLYIIYEKGTQSSRRAESMVESRHTNEETSLLVASTALVPI